MKGKYFVALFVLMVLLFSLSGCAEAKQIFADVLALDPQTSEVLEAQSPEAASQNAAPDASEGFLILHEDFVSVDEWKNNLDGHIVEICDIPTSEQDMVFKTENVSSPEGDGFVGHLIANVNQTPGAVVGAIASLQLADDISQVSDGTYVISVYATALPDSRAQLYDVSFEITSIENGERVAHYFELFVYLNQYLTEETKFANHPDLDVFKGLSYTRTGEKGSKIIPLYNIEDDRNYWHRLELWVTVDKSAAPGEQFMGRRVQITDVVDGDERTYTMDLAVPMWPEVKTGGYSTGMQIFLETPSEDTGCNPTNTFRGNSLWDDLRIMYYPPGVNPPIN